MPIPGFPRACHYRGMAAAITVIQTSWRDFRVAGIHADYVLASKPEPGFPHGRKAILMSDLWRRLRPHGLAGVLWVDPDVAADPDDLAAMAQAVRAHPTWIHTAVLKLWPISTGRDDWIWSHRGGTLGFPAATQDETVPVSYIAMGFVWTPAQLLDAAFPRYQDWEYHQIDVGLSELAQVLGIPMAIVPGCRPKHLHFQPEQHWGYKVPGNT